MKGKRESNANSCSTRTAPKTRGIDDIKTTAIDDEPSRTKLTAKMREIAAKAGRSSFARDAGNIEDFPAVVVIGVESNPAGLTSALPRRRQRR